MTALRRASPAAISFWCGLSSLSLEILWVRFFGHAHLTSPKAFGFVLCAFLAGVAVGAALGRRLCARDADDAPRLWLAMAACLLLSALSAVVLPIAYAVSGDLVDTRVTGFACIAWTAATLAFCFPIAHHLGAQGEAQGQGRRFASVYVSNVAGSALGPLLVGYVLLEQLTVQEAFACVALMQAVAAIGAAAIGWPRLTPARAAVGAAGLVATLAALWLAPADPHWLVQAVRESERPAKAVYENRHGVVSIVDTGYGGDTVYGGNVYDGRTNTNPLVNSNGLHRLTIMSVLQPRPQRVLLVGASIGSWLDVVLHFPGVEHVDVIEINPAYRVAAQPYPEQRAAWAEPRVTVHIDDGRRWLRLHPQAKWDLIVMNTTYHWRSNSTLLLSREFHEVLKSRLNAQGVLCFNATGSLDALYTASRVYAHAYSYENFVYTADHDFRAAKDQPGALEVMTRGLAEPGPAAARERILRGYLAIPFVSYDEARRSSGRDGELITDDNMITEFRYGRPF